MAVLTAESWDHPWVDQLVAVRGHPWAVRKETVTVESTAEH